MRAACDHTGGSRMLRCGRDNLDSIPGIVRIFGICCAATMVRMGVPDRRALHRLVGRVQMRLREAGDFRSARVLILGLKSIQHGAPSMTGCHPNIILRGLWLNNVSGLRKVPCECLADIRSHDQS